MSKGVKINMREFLSYVREDEIGLFVVAKGEEEDLVSAESLIGVAKDIREIWIDRIRGIIWGRLFREDVEIRNV